MSSVAGSRRRALPTNTRDPPPGTETRAPTQESLSGVCCGAPERTRASRVGECRGLDPPPVDRAPMSQTRACVDTVARTATVLHAHGSVVKACATRIRRARTSLSSSCVASGRHISHVKRVLGDDVRRREAMQMRSERRRSIAPSLLMTCMSVDATRACSPLVSDRSCDDCCDTSHVTCARCSRSRQDTTDFIWLSFQELEYDACVHTASLAAAFTLVLRDADHSVTSDQRSARVRLDD